jgi:hypothetical protein
MPEGRRKKRWISRLQATAGGSTFGLRHSFDIRHSTFVIYSEYRKIALGDLALLPTRVLRMA